MRVLVKDYSKEHGPEVTTKQLWYYCPGCKDLHAIGMVPKQHDFNGDFENPTFSPSVLCDYGDSTGKSFEGKTYHRCHSFIENGMIRFLSDCTHELKDQTVQLPHIQFTNDAESDIEPVTD